MQSDGYPLWQQAFAVNGPPRLTPDTIADGTSAPFDPVMFERLGALVSEWALVPEATVRRTVARMATDVKVVAEGAGALAYAAMVDARRDTAHRGDPQRRQPRRVAARGAAHRVARAGPGVRIRRRSRPEARQSRSGAAAPGRPGWAGCRPAAEAPRVADGSGCDGGVTAGAALPGAVVAATIEKNAVRPAAPTAA